MSYWRFAAMLACSTLVMFATMYLNTYALEHVFFSQTRAWMAVLMGGAMGFVMFAFMAQHYSGAGKKATVLVLSLLAMATGLWFVRSQATVSDLAYMRAMIPHHSIAVLTSERSNLRDARVRKLAAEIAVTQQREIAEMRYLIADIARKGAAADTEAPPGPDPEEIAGDEAGLAAGSRCALRFTEASDPVFWASGDTGQAVIKLAGELVALRAAGAGGPWVAEQQVEVRIVPASGALADWRGNADMELSFANGGAAGFRGFWTCGE